MNALCFQQIIIILFRMSEYYQRNLEYVKRAMTVMELKKRSKSELVELASAIGTQTMGTK